MTHSLASRVSRLNYALTVDAHPKCILIADRSSEIRRLIAAYLERRGHCVAEAESGRKTIKLMMQDNVALLILDVREGGGPGWQVLKEHDGSPTMRSIPVIAIITDDATPIVEDTSV